MPSNSALAFALELAINGKIPLLYATSTDKFNEKSMKLMINK